MTGEDAISGVVPPAPLPFRHLLLALAVVLVWGTNFVVIRRGLDELPPLLFGALRFAFALFPAAIVLKRPNVSWRNLALYGFSTGAGQFGLLFLAMRGQISPGLASLVIQAQVFFTIVLAMWIAGERVVGFQWLALGFGAAGIGVIAVHADPSTTPLGLALTLAAALAWAVGNLAVRASGTRDMLAYVVWGSLFAAPSLLVLSLVFEGSAAIAAGIARASWAAWAAVAWQSVGNTLFGFAVWGWLLARHPAATVTPLALLVPILGLAASAAITGEPLPAWKIAAAALVLIGLALGVLYPRWLEGSRRLAARA